MMTTRTPRRHIDAMCEQHRTVDRWPVPGDYQKLAAQCRNCSSLGSRIADEHGLWLRLLPDLSDELVERQAATHEAAHAVVGIATGHTLIVASIADGGGGEGYDEPGGFVTWGPWELPLIDHLATVWAGHWAGLHWLWQNGLDSEANQVDIRAGCWGDAREADEVTRKYGVSPDLGFLRAAVLVSEHWAQIETVADALHARRRMSGEDVVRLLDRN